MNSTMSSEAGLSLDSTSGTTMSYAVIRPQSGRAFLLKRGELLEVIDPEGQQVSDLFCFNADDRSESLSTGRTLDYADSIMISTGDVLYSNRSKKMLTIVSDSCGTHDLLMTPCSSEMFKIVAGNPDLEHPSCLDNLAVNLREFGIERDRISTTFNIFMNVKVDSSGRVKIEKPVSHPGDKIVFRAEMNLLVGLTACSHPESNAGRCKPIRYAITHN